MGFWLDNPHYQEETERAIPQLKRKAGEGYQIIVCGGYTNSLLPWFSEAEQIARVLIINGIPSEALILEDKSIRTYQNITEASRIIKNQIIKEKEEIIEVEEISFVGEKGSEEEAEWLTPKIFYRAGIKIKKIEYLSLFLLNEKARETKEKQLLLIKFSYYFPPLNFLLSFSRWLTIRWKCFKYRHILCTSPLHWGCEGCRLKEILRAKIKGG